MQVDHHDLHSEFPEFAKTIHELKLSNNHFARLFDQYHQATTSVETIEGKGSPVDDATLEEMKKKRLKLKDELYAMLRAHAA